MNTDIPGPGPGPAPAPAAPLPRLLRVPFFVFVLGIRPRAGPRRLFQRRRGSGGGIILMQNPPSLAQLFRISEMK